MMAAIARQTLQLSSTKCSTLLECITSTRDPTETTISTMSRKIQTLQAPGQSSPTADGTKWGPSMSLVRSCLTVHMQLPATQIRLHCSIPAVKSMTVRGSRQKTRCRYSGCTANNSQACSQILSTLKARCVRHKTKSALLEKSSPRGCAMELLTVQTRKTKGSSQRAAKHFREHRTVAAARLLKDPKHALTIPTSQ